VFRVPDDTISSCLDFDKPGDALLERARRDGLSALSVSERRSINSGTGESPLPK
jgi:hypothetical protein